MITNVGLIGVGSFGSVLLEKLIDLSFVNVSWTCNSSSNWKIQSPVDWVVIASPNLFHYEQSEWFLERGVNVFCEKPASLSPQAVIDLYNLADQRGCYFYVDDVYSYHSLPKVNQFIYHKSFANNHSNPIDRIAYHHFYLCTPGVDGVKASILKSTKYSHDKVWFLLDIDGLTYEFDYDLDSALGKKDSLGPYLLKHDALADMLKLVLSGKADFLLNRKLSIFATQTSELVKRELYGTTAVVGGGIYGTTAALSMAYAGFSVHLYEAKDELFAAASGINQYRVHRGYHYPRSSDTITSCSRNEFQFSKFFRECIIRDTQQIYAISLCDSIISGEQFTEVLDAHNLRYKILQNLPNTSVTLLVEEDLYDPNLMKSLVTKRLSASNITLKLSHTIHSYNDLTDYDQKVFATYKTLNMFRDNQINYQFELCEKPIFKLPPAYKGKGIVIMDGPVMCFDPYAHTEYHVAGNVKHAIHSSNTGPVPLIPEQYIEYIDNGIISNCPLTKQADFVDSAKPYFKDICLSEYIGSMFTYRVVLPNLESTDARPSLVDFKDSCAFIFSGKIVNALESANRVVEYFTQSVRV